MTATIISIVWSVISGMTLFFLQRFFKKKEDEDKKKEENRKRTYKDDRVKELKKLNPFYKLDEIKFK